MYKALVEIGDFKKGDVVPDILAEIWLKMYLKAPVEKVTGKQVIEEKQEVEKQPETRNDMLDDYLDRNENTVIKSMRKDKFSKKEIAEMLKLEQSGKNRKDIIKILNNKLKW